MRSTVVSQIIFCKSPTTQLEMRKESESTVAFLWSLTLIQISLCFETHCLWYFIGSVEAAYTEMHHPLGPAAAGVFLTKGSIYWWIEIHVSQFRLTHPTWPSIHVFIPHNSFLSALTSLVLSSHFHPHSIIAQCVISLFPSPPPAPPWSLAILLLWLHLFFITSPSVLSEKLLELPPPEFWSAILWFKKARQTAFPINQYLHWLWLTPVTSALHDGKCSVLEQNSKHLTYPGYSQNLAY